MASGGWPLAGIAAASCAVKLLLVWLVADMPCSHDQCDYLHLADGVLAGQGLQPHDGYLWPPGYIAFLVLCRGLFGDSLTVPRLLQVLASTATVPLVYVLGQRFGGRRAGLAAAALFAFYPNLVGFTHLLWPATLYILFFVAGFTLLVHTPAPGVRDTMAAGIALGLAALIKGQALYFAPLAAVWLLVTGGAGVAPPGDSADALGSGAGGRGTVWRRLPAAAALVLASLLPVLPWTVRNWVTYERLLLVDATSGRNLYIGTNEPPPSNWDLGFDHRRRVHGGRPRCEMPNVVDADRCEIRNSAAFVLANPGLMLARVPLKMADLLNPSSFVIRHARLQKYPHVFSGTGIRLLTLACALPWMLVALLGAAGLGLLPGAPGRGLILLLLAYHLALHSLTFGMTRFRLPIVPFLMVAAAPLLTRAWGPILAAAGPRRWAVVAAAWAALLGLWAARWNNVFDVFGR